MSVAPRSGAQCPSAGTRIAVGALSVGYMSNAINGGRLAIRDNLEESPFGWRSERPVSTEFYWGTGTALSPGLPMLVAQTGVTALLLGSSRTQQRAIDILAVAGALYAIGQLAEPITYRTFRHPTATPERLGVVVQNIVLPAALTAVALRTCH